MSNREIKFRAWSNSLKHMFYPEDNVNEPNLWNLHPCIVGGMLISKKDYELMQYTGLKDCKGKEIYEGDIVRQRRRNWTGKGAVVFDSGCYWFRRSVGGGQEELYIAITNDEVEVIGNISENSELLEVKDV